MRYERTSALGLPAIAILMTLAACDLSPTIPAGRIFDEQLDDPGAAEVVFNGLVGDLEYGVTRVIVHSALAADEIDFTGTRLWYDLIAQGDARPPDVRRAWQTIARGRWTAEHGIERLQEILPDPDADPILTAAHVWAGYALRVMGDAFCEAVFDGAEAQPNSTYYERAIQHFRTTRDRVTGSDLDSLRLAAIAGMAQSHLILGNYELAAELAAQVPNDFIWVAHHTGNANRERNFVWRETHQNPQLTVYNTPLAELDPDGDPRAPWHDTGEMGNGGVVPYYEQLKFESVEDDEPLAKGWEMRLIEAEVRLRAGDITGFLERVNHVRTAFGMDSAEASTEQEAWEVLDHERLVTLWLEGRRLKDNQRFYEEGHNSFLEGRAKCLPFGDTEIAGNPNL